MVGLPTAAAPEAHTKLKNETIAPEVPAAPTDAAKKDDHPPPPPPDEEEKKEEAAPAGAADAAKAKKEPVGENAVKNAAG